MKQIKYLGLGILLSLLLLVSASAYQHPAETYWGYITLDGEVVESGTLTVTTESGMLVAEQELPYDSSYAGSYNVVIRFDDPTTSQIDGALENELLIWKVDGMEIISSDLIALEDYAEPGKVNNDFLLKVLVNPSTDLSFSYASKQKVGENYDLELLFNNKAKGLGRVEIESIEGMPSENFPIVFDVAGDSSKIQNLEINSDICGEKENDVKVNYYNSIGSIVSSVEDKITFEATSGDIVILDVDIASEFIEGDVGKMTISITNEGDVDVQSFDLVIYDNGIEVDTFSGYSYISSDEIFVINYDYDTVGKIGERNIELELVSDEMECITDNNKESFSIVIKEKEVIVESVVENKVSIEFQDRGELITGSTVDQNGGDSSFSWIGIFAFLGILSAVLLSGFLVNYFSEENRIMRELKLYEIGRKKLKVPGDYLHKGIEALKIFNENKGQEVFVQEKLLEKGYNPMLIYLARKISHENKGVSGKGITHTTRETLSYGELAKNLRIYHLKNK